MILFAGVLLGLASTGFAFVTVRGVAALLRRSRRGARRLLRGVGLFLLTLALLIGLAHALGPEVGAPADVAASQKARVLAESISRWVNVAAWGFALGVALGVVAAIWERAVRPSGSDG